MVGQEDNYSVL